MNNFLNFDQSMDRGNQMNTASTDDGVNNNHHSQRPLSPVNDLVVKEILSTEITPTPPEVRLDYWRFKMRHAKLEAGQIKVT